MLRKTINDKKQVIIHKLNMFFLKKTIYDKICDV